MGASRRNLLARLPWLGPLLLLVLMVGALAAVWSSGIAGVESKTDLQEIIDDYGFWAPAAYVLFYALVAFVFPVSLLTVAGGLLFEFWPGLFLSVIGSMLGGLASFLAVRYLGVRGMEQWLRTRLKAGDFISSRIKGLSGLGWFRKRFAAIEEPDDIATEVRSVFTLFMLRMLGPFFAISFLASLSRMSFRAYMMGTLAGAIVANYLLLVFTESLMSLRQPGDLASWDIAVPLLLFLAVVAMPYLFLRFQTQDGDADDDADADPEVPKNTDIARG